MPRHRRIYGVVLSAAAMLLWAVAMAAAREPAPQGPQGPGAPAQDPFDAAAGVVASAPAKDAADKVGDKAAERKAAKKPEPEFVHKSLQEWQRTLPRAVFEVTRLKATEAPFSGKYATGHFDGTFACACCDANLFSSKAKFDSGTGWPSFWQPVKAGAIHRAIDNSEAEPRIEVTCRRCGAHLGHVFDDAPQTPTGLRFCINSLSLKLRTADEAAGTKAPPKSRARTSRARSRTAPRTTRSRAKATVPASSDSTSDTPAGSDQPAAGKADGTGR